jgi:hypothetical protein
MSRLLGWRTMLLVLVVAVIAIMYMASVHTYSRLTKLASSISTSMSKADVERILGKGNSEFPDIEGSLNTTDVDEPAVGRKDMLYWHNGHDVIEIWFVDEKVAFKRHWKGRRSSSDLEFRIRWYLNRRGAGQTE